MCEKYGIEIWFDGNERLLCWVLLYFSDEEERFGKGAPVYGHEALERQGHLGIRKRL